MSNALGVTAWIERHHTVHGGLYPGPYRFDTTPYLRGVAEALFEEHGPRRIILAAAAMTGKTEMLIGLAAYAEAHADPTVLLMASDRDAMSLRRSKVWSRVDIRIATASHAMRARPARCVLADEIDDYPASVEASGDPLSLLRQKMQTFSDGKELWVSSPSGDASRILREYYCTDQRRFFVPCPHCSEFQVLEFRRLRWEAERPLSVAYVCRHCDSFIDEASKTAMITAGQWRATAVPQVRDSVGFHVSALYKPWSRWGDLVQAWEKAKQEPMLSRVFQDLCLAEPLAVAA